MKGKIKIGCLAAALFLTAACVTLNARRPVCDLAQDECLRQWYARPSTQWPPAELDASVGKVELQALPKLPELSESEQKKVALGKKLFFEKGLSSDGTVACASCHLPEYAFADKRRVSIGVAGRQGSRNASSLVHLSERGGMHFFWDGRAKTLGEQTLMPLSDPLEMDRSPADIPAVLNRLGYTGDFQAALFNFLFAVF